jgi:hypothetical protein
VVQSELILRLDLLGLLITIPKPDNFELNQRTQLIGKDELKRADAGFGAGELSLQVRVRIHMLNNNLRIEVDIGAFLLHNVALKLFDLRILPRLDILLLMLVGSCGCLPSCDFLGFFFRLWSSSWISKEEYGRISKRLLRNSNSVNFLDLRK